MDINSTQRRRDTEHQITNGDHVWVAGAPAHGVPVIEVEVETR
jgi:hypothetical protein